MKLAEALQERADLKHKIDRLRERIRNNVLVQEGEKPAEDPKLLIRELSEAAERFEYIISKVNLTNSTIKVGDATLTELIARKDALHLKASAYRDIVFEASAVRDRVRGSEIKFLPVISVTELQKEVDDISKEIRLLDNKLQEKNWTTDLIE